MHLFFIQFFGWKKIIINPLKLHNKVAAERGCSFDNHICYSIKMRTVVIENVDYSIITPIVSTKAPSVLLYLQSPEKNKSGDENSQELKIEVKESSLKTFLKTLNNIQVEIDRLLNIQ